MGSAHSRHLNILKLDQEQIPQHAADLIKKYKVFEDIPEHEFVTLARNSFFSLATIRLLVEKYADRRRRLH